MSLLICLLMLLDIMDDMHVINNYVLQICSTTDLTNLVVPTLRGVVYGMSAVTYYGGRYAPSLSSPTPNLEHLLLGKQGELYPVCQPNLKKRLSLSFK